MGFWSGDRSTLTNSTVGGRPYQPPSTSSPTPGRAGTDIFGRPSAGQVATENKYPGNVAVNSFGGMAPPMTLSSALGGQPGTGGFTPLAGGAVAWGQPQQGGIGITGHPNAGQAYTEQHTPAGTAINSFGHIGGMPPQAAPIYRPGQQATAMPQNPAGVQQGQVTQGPLSGALGSPPPPPNYGPGGMQFNNMPQYGQPMPSNTGTGWGPAQEQQNPQAQQAREAAMRNQLFQQNPGLQAQWQAAQQESARQMAPAGSPGAQFGPISQGDLEHNQRAQSGQAAQTAAATQANLTAAGYGPIGGASHGTLGMDPSWVRAHPGLSPNQQYGQLQKFVMDRQHRRGGVIS